VSAPNRADSLRREVAARNEAAILDAALSQLERDAGATLVDIAKAAGVSRPTLYAHFPTREDLIEAAVKRALDDTQRDLRAANLDQGPARDALERLIGAGWRSLYRHLEIARLALDALPPERLRQVHHEALDPVRKLILRGQRAGEFRNDQPPEWMITVLLALLHAAAAEVIAERLNEDAAAHLIHGSALAAIDHRPTK
jgi:TetR/AcrR family transcriptional regulator, mexCD-oprJ operon repressor